MSEIRLHDGELNVMELLWSNKSLAAKDIAKIIHEYIGWEKNTTYTVIKRLIDKGAIIRQEPGFVCVANISKKKVQEIEMSHMLNSLFNNSMSAFISEYLKNQKLGKFEIIELQRLINQYK